MSTDFNESIAEIQTHEDKLTTANARVARFSYTESAYQSYCADGVAEYNYGQEQNIPLGNPAVLNTAGYILDKGVRSQASSMTRMMLNHFFGRVSYNVNKLADYMKSFLSTFKAFLKEGDNAWSATTTYETGDIVFIVTNLAGKKSKRTFIALQESTNLPPADTVTGNLLNTSYWTEISGNFASINADGDIRVNGQLITEKDIVAHGNLYVDGNITATTETQVATSGDFLVTRENNNTPMSQGDFSGLAVNNYATGKMATLTADHCGEWRASDSATVSSVVYTALSQFEGIFYTGLTRTVAPAYPTHVMTNVQLIELDGVVFYNGNYYDKIGEEWYGPVTVVNNAFNTGSVITDPAVISALEALTPSSLVYYITVTDNEIDASQNQPLLTRSESACFADKDLFMWDSAERKAVPLPKPTAEGTVLTGCFDPNTHALLSYAWSGAGTASNANKVKVTRSTYNCNRLVLLGTDSYTSDCFSCVYVPDNCKLTFNPATGEFKTGSLAVAGNYINKVLLTAGQYNQWILLQDITTWYNSSAYAPTSVIEGRITSYKDDALVSAVVDANIGFSWGRSGCPLSTPILSRQRFSYTRLGEVVSLTPVVICENATGKVYTALRKSNADFSSIHFSGNVVGDILGTQVPGGGQNVTIPSGWTHLYEAPLGGMVSCAESATSATCAEGFKCLCSSITSSCWLKIGIFNYIGAPSHLKLTLVSDWGSVRPSIKTIEISTGAPIACNPFHVTEDSFFKGEGNKECQIRFAYGDSTSCPVDIYVRYNCSGCTSCYTLSYCYTGRATFTPAFFATNSTGSCACICDIPLHANGHYINGCQFDTTLANTACVNASCVNASCAITTKSLTTSGGGLVVDTGSLLGVYAGFKPDTSIGAGSLSGINLKGSCMAGNVKISDLASYFIRSYCTPAPDSTYPLLGYFQGTDSSTCYFDNIHYVSNSCIQLRAQTTTLVTLSTACSCTIMQSSGIVSLRFLMFT